MSQPPGAFVNDLKIFPEWHYREYSDEEVNALTTWINGNQFAKEMVMGENLWENMKKLSNRVGIHTHPVFEYHDYFVKLANKDTELKGGSRDEDDQPKIETKPEIAGNKTLDKLTDVDKDKSNIQVLKKMTYLILNHTKMDVFTLILMSVALPPTKIDTIKVVSCGFGQKELELFMGLLKSPKIKIRKLFLDWCPELKDRLPELAEVRSLEFLIIRGCQLEDEVFQKMMSSMRDNGVRLRLLDVFSNRLTDKSAEFLTQMCIEYRFLESIGLGLNQIQHLSCFYPLFDKVGTFEVSKMEYDGYLNGLKQREAIITKNQKLKTMKKPEEPIPYLEEVVFDEGTNKYFKKQFANLTYLNLVGNRLEKEDSYGPLEQVLKRGSHFSLILTNTKAEKQIDSRIIESHADRLYLSKHHH